MIVINIESMSTIQSLTQVKEAAAISIMKMSMDVMKSQGVEMVKALEMNNKMMERSVNPHLGGTLDIQI